MFSILNFKITFITVGPLSRWDFLQGEMAMQRRTYLTSRCTASRNYRRKLQKKLMHHKQQLEDIEAAKKAFHATQVIIIKTNLFYVTCLCSEIKILNFVVRYGNLDF